MAQPKFIVDYMCGRLAKWLRMLGYDTVYLNKNLKQKILLKSLQEQRIVITRNTKLSPKKAYKLIFIKYDKVFDQIKQVFEELKLRPTEENFFHRCSLCNSLLVEIEKEKIKEVVPEYVFNTQEKFFKCDKCNKVYWKGTHYDLFLSDLRKIFDL